MDIDKCYLKGGRNEAKPKLWLTKKPQSFILAKIIGGGLVIFVVWIMFILLPVFRYD